MERDKVNLLYAKAVYNTKDKQTALWEFARLVEKETLERAAEKLESQHVWITNIAASALIRELKI